MGEEAELTENFSKSLQESLKILRDHAGRPGQNKKWKVTCEIKDNTGNHVMALPEAEFDFYYLSVVITPVEDEDLEDIVSVGTSPVTPEDLARWAPIRPEHLWHKDENDFEVKMGISEEMLNIFRQVPVVHLYSFILETADNGGYKLNAGNQTTTNYRYLGMARLQLKASQFDYSDNWYQDLWVSDAHFLGECTRVLLRLTAQPDGSLVDLWDLVDDRSLNKKYTAYLIIRTVFAWACKKAPCPAKYDPNTGVFTKTSKTFDGIKELISEFEKWGVVGKRD